MAGTVIVYGLDDSVYVRIVRIALIEKGIEYELRQSNVFDPATLDPDYETIHPFRKVPAFEHDGFRIYETSAIVRYIDEAMAGPALQPAGKRARARMNQIISVIDSYAYYPLIQGLVIERLFAAEMGRAPDEKKIAASVPNARHAFTAIMALASGPYLTGTMFTLADAWLAAFVGYIRPTKEGAALVEGNPALSRWWETVAQLPSVAGTKFPVEN